MGNVLWSLCFCDNCVVRGIQMISKIMLFILLITITISETIFTILYETCLFQYCSSQPQFPSYWQYSTPLHSIRFVCFQDPKIQDHSNNSNNFGQCEHLLYENLVVVLKAVLIIYLLTIVVNNALHLFYTGKLKIIHLKIKIKITLPLPNFEGMK